MREIHVNVKEYNAYIKLNFNGFNFNTSAILQSELMKLVSNKIIKNVYFDFSKVNYILSVGIAILVEFYRKISLREGQIVLQNLDIRIKQVFRSNKLDKLMTIE